MATGDGVNVQGQRGFTYLGALFLVAAVGVALAAVGTLWQTARQREKERELLFVGHQFRRAIMLYYERSPGAVKRYPKTLNDLLQDDRQPLPQRYLRRIFVDPMTGKAEWGTVEAPDGGIMGVYSLSEGNVFKTGNFYFSDRDLAGGTRYRDWKFFYSPSPLMAQQAGLTAGTKPSTTALPAPSPNALKTPRAGPGP